MPGTWTVQNKVRPGAYINFKSEGQTLGTLSDRGIMTIPLVLDWGPKKTVEEITPAADFEKLLGHSLFDEELILIKEAFKRVNKVLAYRICGGAKATKAADTLTVTAKYEGARGNDITVTITEDVDVSGLFNVVTLLDGKEVDVQRSSTIENLKANDYVEFSGTGPLAENAGIVLENGENAEPTSQDYIDYFEDIQVFEFNTMALPVNDSTVKSSAVSYIQRLREDEGKKVQLVLPDYSSADYEGVISVKNGVKLTDGTVIDKVKATAWVAAATAGANVNESNTYSSYEDAVDVDTKYTNSQIIDALTAGEFVFVQKSGRAVVEQDINTLTSFTPQKSKIFAKNRVVRVLDAIGNDINNIYTDYYAGKVDNNEDGRNLFKAEVIKYFETLQNIGAIQNFDAGSDIQVEKGTDIDAVVVEIAAQPVDSMEKLYMTVVVS